MSTEKFVSVHFPVATLLSQIETGQIGLPELQRPFVWDRAQVRDLMDSLYKGFPAGYFLLWQNSPVAGGVPIGADGKQTTPQLLVVDGQQRLTSLYAVFKGAEVYTEKFEKVSIRIAFHPLKQRFEVANNIIDNDVEWIGDISPLLNGAASVFSFITDYIQRLEAAQELTPATKDHIANAIQRLVSLNGYTFSAIQLSYDLPIEEVAEIFVRINSKGTQLDQADFILTLMSVYWDKGRKELEDFCREAKIPSQGASPFNWFIHPSPDQMLRVAIGLGHRRARLKYAYELLRGKDLKTQEISAEARASNFDKLKEAQAVTLDLTNWTEFLKSLQQAGFRSGKMITSNNSIVFSYLVFLIGRQQFGLDYITLRKAIARWFLMCVLTSRYTGAAESQVEKDLARFGDAQSGEQFLATLDQIITSNLHDDFWGVALPDQLGYSGGYLPAMFAYYAALNLLGAKVLFSDLTVHQALDPVQMGKKAAVERHHLFPKAYLESIGIKGTSRTNRVANFALLEWPTNIKVSDEAPSTYFPKMFADTVPAAEAEQAMFLHALPVGWEEMPYDDFLAKRQKMIANVIRAGFEKLSTGAAPFSGVPVPEHVLTIEELISAGESVTVEYKSSMLHSYKADVPEKVIVGSVLKTVAAFLNSDGGTLLIGVADSGEILGIEPDLTLKKFDLDKYENFLTTSIVTSMGPLAATKCAVTFDERDGKAICVVEVARSSQPVFADTDKGKGVFFIRAGNSTRTLESGDLITYVAERFGVAQ